jgi:Activator of Hsp90 ATPase homolog 1-like protein
MWRIIIMDLSKEIQISSEIKNIYRCLLSPTELKEWWQCTAVVDPRENGVWALGWGEDPENHGHQTVMLGFIQSLIPNSTIEIYIDPIIISFQFTQGVSDTVVTITQKNYPDPESAEGSLQSWVDSILALKVYVEDKYPLQNVATPVSAPVATPISEPEPTPVSAPVATPVSAPVATPVSAPAATPVSAPAATPVSAPVATPVSAPAAAPVAEPVSAPAAEPVSAPAVAPVKTPVSSSAATTEYKILDNGGFDVTSPWGTVVKWEKEHGFGYVNHEKLGDVMFDYDGCDFEPAIGDKVLMLILKKAWNGKPSCKRIACPEKGSNVSK